MLRAQRSEIMNCVGTVNRPPARPALGTSLEAATRFQAQVGTDREVISHCKQLGEGITAFQAVPPR